MQTVAQLLSSRPYPGRGCIGARTRHGDLTFLYFLTGRSVASRARQLQVVGTDIAVANAAGANLDMLRHYVAGVRRGRWSVIGNGDQVVPIAQALATGESLPSALGRHTYEPDPPIFTPRMVLAYGGPDESFLGWVGRDSRGAAVRQVQACDPAAGEALVMTTYAGTVDEVVTGAEPVSVAVVADTRAQLLREAWNALDPDLRVAAFAVAPDDPSARPAFIAERSAPLVR